MKHIRILLLTLLFLSISVPSHAADSKWRIHVPNWIETLATDISERINAVVDQSITAKQDRDKQVTCIALAVYYESRGEPVAGQKAVAAVVMNRVRSPKFPSTPCEVVFQPYQFSFVGPHLKPSDMGSWERAIAIANEYKDKQVMEIPYLFFNSISKRGFRIGRHSFY